MERFIREVGKVIGEEVFSILVDLKYNPLCQKDSWCSDVVLIFKSKNQ
jgi:hypothetical protein